MTHTPPQTAPRPRALVLALLAAMAVLALAAPSAGAAAPDFVLRMPEGSAETGGGAGQLDNPRGIAGDPNTGHVYVSELENARISEFTAWGIFVKAWGWDVAPDGAPGDTASDQLETCTTTCKAGVKGNGAGQLDAPTGIAIDSSGALYIYELGEQNRRVQKFDPEGHFLLMFGGEVDKTTKADLCTQTDLEGGDVCGSGVPGTGTGQFSNGQLGDYLSYDPAADTIFVGDTGRIEEFNTNGSFKSQVPFEGQLAALAGKSVNGLDVDSAGNLYVTLSALKDVYKLSPLGEPLAPGKPGETQFEVPIPLGVTVIEGNVYVVKGNEKLPDYPTDYPTVPVFDPTGTMLLPTKTEEEEQSALTFVNENLFPYIPFHGPRLTALATNFCPGSEAPGSLYLGFFSAEGPIPMSYVNAYGSGPVGCEPPPSNPPQITAQYATSVSRDDATLRAQINPRFWRDATYYVEYGTGKCSEGGCEAKAPISPASLTGKAVSSVVTTASVFLGGLQPGTTYHYRFVTESSGGGPVYGVGGKPGQDGAEGTFETFAAAAPPAPCPANEAFRTGPAAKLPDCRGYEMVSPLEKNNADVALWLNVGGGAPRTFELHQSATSGDRFTFTSSAAFADPQSAPYISQYLAERSDEAWTSESISPPRTAPLLEVDRLGNLVSGFSSDLCSVWLLNNSVAPLAEGAVEGFPNLYRRENCAPSPAYEALTTVEPPHRAPSKYEHVQLQGASRDGTHSIFVANDELDSDAPTLKENERLLYEHTPEGLRFVCYLPSGKPSPQACSAGTGAGGGQSSVRNAISANGSRIFWTAYSGDPGFGEHTGVPGQIYVRIDGTETVKVSGSVSPDPAWYWTAADDGSKAIFEFNRYPQGSGSVEDQLYEFDVETRTSRLIAKGVQGPMGASEDASRIYFDSTEDLDGGGPASKGAHNLYLYEAGEEGGEGSFTFIMALDPGDIGGSLLRPAPIDEVPAQRSAAVSADGRHAAFTSVASPTPTGYDNTDAASGEADQEVYLYDAVRDKLTCVSCNPTGARPAGAIVAKEIQASWGAARIQGWEIMLHAPHVLSDDGSRLYFESHEALAPRDTNGTWDVYQWEEPGAGSCTQADPTYSDTSGGCVDLISSGESSAASTFLDADPSGQNVFISTQSSLVGADYGLSDVYDARVGGGFAEPQPPAACEGEACQGPLSAPDDPTPASSSFEGAGNVNGAKPSCRRPKVRRRGRCVAKHRGRAGKAKRNGRAGR